MSDRRSQGENAPNQFSKPVGPLPGGCRRLASKSSRKDFLTNIIDKVEVGEVGKEELTAHVSTLVYESPNFLGA